MFKFDVNIAKSDHDKFVLFHSDESRYSKKGIRFARIFLLIFFLVVSVAIVLSNLDVGARALFSVIPIAIPCVLMFFLIGPINRLGHYMKGKRYYSPVSTIEFFDEYISEVTPKTKLRFRYPAMEIAYVVKNEAVYIYRNYRQAFIIPRECAESQEQWDSFSEFLKSKIKDVAVIN